MKKIKYLILLLLFMPLLVNAKDDKIHSIDVNITLKDDGSAHIVEVWNVTANMGTEFYKAQYNLGNMEISNFKVYENNREFTFINNWDIDASLREKAYKNGYYYSNGGLELCFGKGSMGKHTFTLSYDISNFIFRTNDAEVLYFNIINEMDQGVDNFTATITGPNYFSDTLDVWGYGYKGYAYVLDGKIMMSNEENTKLSSSDYAVLLVKFPLGTFNISDYNRYSYYQTFDDVLDKANENTFSYDYEDKFNIFESIMTFIFSILPWAFFVFIVVGFGKFSQKYKFLEAGKKIDMRTINNFRDIPCDKDIFNAYFIAQVYNLNKTTTDFLGAVFLKWLFERKIEIKKVTTKTLFGEKQEEQIILKQDVIFTNSVENELYNILIKASKNYILESKELEKWSKNNYNKLFKWFDSAESYGRNNYISKNLVYKERLKYVIKNELKEEAIKLAGLKKYLMEFSRIHEKTAIEVMLWKEYLMYAQIFGIAKEVASQFKELYPDLLQQESYGDIDFTDIIIINHISNAAVASATSARSAAQSYSSGGGGFSSGGGGGGSFGGGGGGGR